MPESYFQRAMANVPAEVWSKTSSALIDLADGTISAKDLTPPVRALLAVLSDYAQAIAEELEK